MIRISLRQLMLIVLLVAVAILSLKFASAGWQAVIGGLAMITLFAALVVAAVDRGPRQAFAIGYLLVMVSYGVIVLNGARSSGAWGSKSLEMDQWEGRLPTTLLLRYIHMAVDKSEWFDDSTGKVVPNYSPPAGGGFGSVRYREVPPREVFMPIGHYWWAILLGACGGIFARWVYLRRTREQLAAPRT